MEFDQNGLLPAGDYDMTFDDLRSSLLVVGPGSEMEPDWDESWRLKLVENAEVLVRQLWSIGVQEVFLDGSFVEQKAHPNDIDGYFVCGLSELASGDLQNQLNRVDPHAVWTWDPRSRKAYRGYTKKQLPMWHAYRVELYPHVAGLLSGIQDKYGNELQFPAAFRRSRGTGAPRGIVHLIPDAA